MAHYRCSSTNINIYNKYIPTYDILYKYKMTKNRYVKLKKKKTTH